MKCRYMDELTGGRGVIFATGTPVSNSDDGALYGDAVSPVRHAAAERADPFRFSWASTFGETTTAIELAPEGTGYRARTRFAKVLQPAGADEYVQGGGRHQDLRPAASAGAGGKV